MGNLKLGFYTDIHWSGQTPKRRKDNYPAAVKRKHEFIYKDGEERGVDVWGNAGDLNEAPYISNSMINLQIDVMKKRTKREFCTIGNHDVVGNNSNKIHQVSIGILFNAGYLERLSKTEPIRFEQNGVTLAVFGVDIHEDMDNLRPEDYYIEKPDWCDYAILFAHGWLVEKTIAMEGVKTTTFDSVVATGTQADVIYTGHFHPGHGTVAKEMPDGRKILFHNCGSPTRTKAKKSELTRKVGYSISTYGSDGNIDIEFVEFPKEIAPAGEDVLDRAQLEADIERDNMRQSIQAKFSGTEIKAKSIKSVIMEMLDNEKLSPDAKQDLMRRIEKAEEEQEMEIHKDQV